ncbi:antA/AntB antirepressor family protein [Enterococcus casseliflavus]|uniref:antA/AntB antirepressor family protein n=1 Tax=Enterococcus casseliflavus TaxID=37734 RepID=UPI0039A4FD83
MNELIKVTTNDNDEQLVSGRELHGFLEVETPYKKWFDRMSEYGFAKNVDFTVLDKNVRDDTSFGGARKITDHAMKLDMAKEVSMIQRTDKGKQARQYFIQVEKQYKQQQLDTSNLSPELQMFQGLFTAVAKQEIATKQLESKIDSVSEIVSLNTLDWRKNANSLINQIARIQGGGSDTHREVRNEIYKEVERRAGVNLSIRVTNSRRRMADEGVSKSKRDKLNQVDAIAGDKKLVEIYLSTVKDFAIKYQIWNDNF